MKIFLLAHQDDEVFFLPHLIDSEKKVFIYLTNGVSKSSTQGDSIKRINEAKNIFDKSLSSYNAEAIWWGSQYWIPEGELHNSISDVFLEKLAALISTAFPGEKAIYSTTFEGAHQDHDSAAVIARKIAKNLGLDLIEMPTYPMGRTNFYSYKVMYTQHPQFEYGYKRRIVVWLAIKLMFGYKTQIKTWIGLGPFVLFKYAFGKYESSSPLPVDKMRYCFYEFRGRARQDDVIIKLSKHS